MPDKNPALIQVDQTIKEKKKTHKKTQNNSPQKTNRKKLNKIISVNVKCYKEYKMRKYNQ